MDSETRTARNFVGGAWTDPSRDGADVENPATGETVGRVGFSDETDVGEAVTAAAEAFASWRETPVEERIQPLFRLKSLLEDEQEELAELLVCEHGKTLAEARGEIRRGIENVEVACGAPTAMQAGHLSNAAPEIDETAVRRPVGVFAAVTPFNFPAMIPLWFLPYAVATGNAFVLKPSERDPHTPTRIVELAAEAGFPDGVVNLVHGDADAVNALCEHPEVAGVSFVGSTPVARHVYETAAANGKRVQAQGGAKNHVVVSATADLETAVDGTVGSAFANAGQRCLANPVAVVEDAVYDEFAARLVERVESMVVGDGLDEETEMGPLVSAAHRDSVAGYVETGVEEGAELLVDGRTAETPDEGHFLGPTVFGDAPRDSALVGEEIFGPILALVRVPDFGAAVDVVNDSRYGNAASLFTASGAEAERFRHEAEPGNLGVNVGTAAPMAFFHFGGAKESFFGDLHAQGDDAVRFYTDETVYIERWPDA
ncbi:CoA-acylating methylmalonate-semialdehyde dehydrogenase [Halogeometricum sp. S1BR25-6]|uniref:CoA-acylating methylmalonate-semialdehyde dehydrogenase n=1 Tax=Halogeometricum salsisoli TaxID=2950536 RepID=A0ABU2GEM1_9EURY|nr:CoA-acylating methylmalonate-semialdehyde dehydrogenase [Halogeometricum sp. S1BR25-6]MDS0299252.1 CoA-acylating methylmalonate-semialdehyde dehydrogenase [Halogeometricum sp. S1BR25-6]